MSSKTKKDGIRYFMSRRMALKSAHLKYGSLGDIELTKHGYIIIKKEEKKEKE